MSKGSRAVTRVVSMNDTYERHEPPGWLMLHHRTLVTWRLYWEWMNSNLLELPYVVAKIPFVEGFHLCEYDRTMTDYYRILSSHKTKHEAMDICRVLIANRRDK